MEMHLRRKIFKDFRFFFFFQNKLLISVFHKILPYILDYYSFSLCLSVLSVFWSLLYWQSRVVFWNVYRIIAATLKASFIPMIQCHEAGKGHASTFHPEHTRLALRECALPASIHALRGSSFSGFLITCPSATPQQHKSKTKSSLRRLSSSNSNPHTLPLVLSMWTGRSHRLLAVWPWSSHLTCRYLSFLTLKSGWPMLSFSWFLSIKGGSSCIVLCKVSGACLLTVWHAVYLAVICMNIT